MRVELVERTKQRGFSGLILADDTRQTVEEFYRSGIFNISKFSDAETFDFHESFALNPWESRLIKVIEFWPGLAAVVYMVEFLVRCSHGHYLTVCLNGCATLSGADAKAIKPELG